MTEDEKHKELGKEVEKALWISRDRTLLLDWGWTIEDGEENYYKEIDSMKHKISIARCARLSYQTLGDNPVIDYEKDLELYDVLSKSGHWSPFEHVARVMTDDEYHYYAHTKPLNGGVYTERGWCRNFKGFIQYRELLDN